MDPPVFSVNLIFVLVEPLAICRYSFEASWSDVEDGWEL